MKIYVVTHKPFEAELPPNYEYIQVNAARNEPFCRLTDHSGDNISEKNPFFCELTATYWIWKNDKVNDIVGLAHYRRFLTTNRFSSSCKHYLNSPEVEKFLKKYDFIATKLHRSNTTVKEHLEINVREKDFQLLRETVGVVCPEYLPTFDEVFSGHLSYLLNVMICKKSQWDKYCEWLFSILFEMEKHVDMTGYSVQEQRLYGFLAERLFTVYVRKNNYRVKSFPTYLVGESKWRIMRQKLLRILHLGG